MAKKKKKERTSLELVLYEQQCYWQSEDAKDSNPECMIDCYFQKFS